MNTENVDLPLILFWLSMAVTVTVYGAWAWSSIQPRARKVAMALEPQAGSRF